jgi:FAD synthetase
VTTVVAQGTFDILHPGHLHYLQQAKAMGETLHVIVARSSNVNHKPDPVVPGGQRVEMVGALDPVDHARLGHPEDIFVPIEEIEPDVIALGHDQHHDDAAIEAAAAERGVDLEVRRATPREPGDGEELLSSGRIIDAILEQRG